MWRSFDKRFVVGIDLGTTNSAVAYADLQAGKGAEAIRIFKIPQVTGPGEVSRSTVLPSFLYLPGVYDLAPASLRLPWMLSDTGPENPPLVGIFARDHGAKIPSRLIASAKSWLCHQQVDRKAGILPWGAEGDVPRMSPVQTTAAYLSHIRQAWNHSRGDDEDMYLEHQGIILTVPASFDEVARELTLEAAELAGLPSVTLLEEPLAAFYNWLIRHENRWRQYVSPGELILVCDVGGGTTDFTLISLREVDGSPRFERIAVGDHLILGGDNIDLALARSVEAQLGKKARLSGDRWKTLCHQCRQAKEVLLGGEAASRKITLMGEGSRLIAGTLSAELDARTVEHIVLEGFFPVTAPDIRQPFASRKGITEFGLPYEQEPAVTRHLGWFLERHQEDIFQYLGKHHMAPDCVLFNGGALKPEIIQNRIREAIRAWFHESDTALPRVLENSQPDLAVALGAAYYGMVKTGRGVRVGSGSPRSYYLGVASGVEGMHAKPVQAVCLVERGLDEGSQVRLGDREFQVRANQPVSFDLFSSSFRSGDKVGQLAPVDETLARMPSIQTVIQYGKKSDEQCVPVDIEAVYTEIGTLSLWCHSRVSDHRWKLQFQLRETAGPGAVADQEVFDASRMEAVYSRLREAFLPPAAIPLLASVVKDVTRVIGRSRDEWPLSLIRGMADVLLSLMQTRMTAPEFESRWLHLLGFCLRPGFGDGFDAHRIEALWKIYPQGLTYSGNAQGRLDWWILWRRVSGGLGAGRQRQFFQDVSPLILSSRGGKQRMAPHEYLEIWMAAASMERLAVKDKIRLGRRLLSELTSGKKSPQLWWAMSRIAARDPLYGPVDRVIPPGEIAEWISALLMKVPADTSGVGAALLSMARKTGDRARDVDESVTTRVVDWLSQNGVPEQQRRVLWEVTPLKCQEITAAFGDELPSGLVLTDV